MVEHLSSRPPRGTSSKEDRARSHTAMHLAALLCDSTTGGSMSLRLTFWQIKNNKKCKIHVSDIHMTYSTITKYETNAFPQKAFSNKMSCNSHLGLEPCSHVLPDLLLEAISDLLSTIHNHHDVWKQKRRCETPVGVVWCSCWYVICVLCVICVTLIAFVVFFVVPESLAKVLAFCFWIFPTFLKALKRFPKLFSEIRVLAADQSVGLPKRRATISMTIRTKLGGLPKFRSSKMSFLGSLKKSARNVSKWHKWLENWNTAEITRKISARCFRSCFQ